MSDDDGDEKHNCIYLEKELYALMQSKESEIFKFLQEGSLDGIWYWDLENPEYEWMSPRFKEVFGYTDEEILNTPKWWQENIHPDDLPVTLENFEQHKKDPNYPYDQICRYAHKDGSTVWVRCRGLIIRDQNDKPIRMLGAHTDVTKLKLAQFELEEKNKELQALNEELDKFVYIASHDLQEPLRMISSYCSLLEKKYKDKLDDKANKYIHYVTDGTTRMQSLIQDLLKYSRATRQELEKEDVKFDDIFDAVKGNLSERIENSGAVVTLKDMPEEVYCDKIQIVQVFQNLISNSIKFCKKEHPEITISCVDRVCCLEFSIKDNGIGIKKEHQDRIFEAFQRLHTREEYEGTGIGLSVVQKIIMKHEGEIWLDSALNKGTIFYFTIPQKAAECNGDN